MFLLPLLALICANVVLAQEFVVGRSSVENAWLQVTSNGLNDLISVSANTNNYREQNMKSTDDGTTFRYLAAPAEATNEWSCIAHGRGDGDKQAYVILSEGPGSIGTNKAAYSEDGGSTWGLASTTNSQNRFADVAFKAGVFAAVGKLKNFDAIAKSTDFGQNWFSEVTPFGGVGQWMAITANTGSVGNTMFVVVGDCTAGDSECVMTQSRFHSAQGLLKQILHLRFVFFSNMFIITHIYHK